MYLLAGQMIESLRTFIGYLSYFGGIAIFPVELICDRKLYRTIGIDFIAFGIGSIAIGMDK
jgi:hypothetical protein